MPSNGARSGSWTEATTGDPVIPICPSSPRAHRWGERPMTPGPRFRCRRHSSDIKEVAAQSWQCAIPRDKNAMVSVRHLIGAAVELWRQQRAAGLPSALRRQGQSRPNPARRPRGVSGVFPDRSECRLEIPKQPDRLPERDAPERQFDNAPWWMSMVPEMERRSIGPDSACGGRASGWVRHTRSKTKAGIGVAQETSSRLIHCDVRDHVRPPARRMLARWAPSTMGIRDR